MKHKLARYLSIYKFFNKISKISTKKDKDYKALYIILAVVIGGPFFFIITSFLFGAYMYFEVYQAAHVIIYMGISLTAIVIILMNMLNIMSSFYFTENASHYLHFPIKPRELLVARLAVHLKTAYFIQIISLLPFLIVYVSKNFGIALLLKSILVYALLPIASLSVVSIVVMIIMKHSRLFKNKEFFKGFAGVVSIVFALGFNMIIRQSNMGDANPEDIKNMIDIMLSQYTYLQWFPDLRFGSMMFVETGISAFINILLFIISVAVYFTAFLIVGEKIYLKGALSLGESNTRTKKNAAVEIKKSKKNSAQKAYILYEIKKVLRNPQMFVSVILFNFFWTGYIFIAPMLDDDKQGIIQYLQNPQSGSIVMLVILGMIVFVMSSNIIFYTPISRMGDQIQKEKFLPIEVKKLLSSKIIANILIASILILIYLIILIAIKARLNLILWFLPSALAVVIFLAVEGMLTDLRNPRLEWETERDLTKNNYSGLKILLLQLPIVIAVVALTFFIKDHTQINSETLPAVIVIIIYSLCTAISFKSFKKNGEALYKKITE